MLSLTRKQGERIQIGENIWVVVVEIDKARNRVRLGIEAPRHIPIYREEVIPVNLNEGQSRP